MPLYLCQPGTGATEPWRHGIQVYAAPFDMDGAEAAPHDATTASSPSGQASSRQTLAQFLQNARRQQPPQPQSSTVVRRRRPRPQSSSSSPTAPNADADAPAQAEPPHSNDHASPTSDPSQPGVPVRRVRHAEVVLVDDVCSAFGRYWLRLRWPGQNGGFAGYIALGKVSENDLDYEIVRYEDAADDVSNQQNSALERNHVRNGNSDHADTTNMVGIGNNTNANTNDIDASGDERAAGNDTGNDDERPQSHTDRQPTGEDEAPVDQRTSYIQSLDFGREDDDAIRDDTDEPQDNASTTSAEPFEASAASLTCLRTGIEFPSSVAMKLLAIYDDNLSPPVCPAPLPSEPVFCRICREGLHDDADDQQPTPVMENEDRNASSRDDLPADASGQEDVDEPFDDQAAGPQFNTDATSFSAPQVCVEIKTKGPVHPHPKYRPNPHADENPFLAPCECAGSMAFVHYLCLEQWRCRSRHPAARHGLNCETCGGEYALPPPSNRVQAPELEHWVEGMPPHVIMALRQPHIWWRIGTAIVHRRWLRPVAPIIISPIVALYCRARRLLKKKGVSRRRWACSLCRRRARWKCVRCLRSYYCSRQCQNASWHTIHKHVCFKPERFWASVAVYGLLTVLVFPGIIRDPFMYDLAFVFVPISFYVVAVLGGGIATVIKRTRGTDLRGRTFEVVVVLATMWLVFISWGFIGGFFGNPSSCRGVMGSFDVEEGTVSARFLKLLQLILFKPAQKYFHMWDRLIHNVWPRLRRMVCSRAAEPDSGCFEHLPNANADFFLPEHDGGKCASDLMLTAGIYSLAGVAACLSYGVKRRDRQQRALQRRHPRPHQD